MRFTIFIFIFSVLMAQESDDQEQNSVLLEQEISGQQEVNQSYPHLNDSEVEGYSNSEENYLEENPLTTESENQSETGGRFPASTKKCIAIKSYYTRSSPRVVGRNRRVKGHNIVGALSRGRSYSIINRVGSWYKLGRRNYANTSAFSCNQSGGGNGSNSGTSSGSRSSTQNKCKATKSYNIRKSATSRSAKRGNVSRGSTYAIQDVSANGLWFKIGSQKWVHKNSFSSDCMNDGGATQSNEVTGNSGVCNGGIILNKVVNGGYLSSGYGKRRHPIEGKRKMHTGCDYAVPKGTPVKAPIAGKITYRGYCGGYGNSVTINSNTRTSTQGCKNSRQSSQGVTTFMGHMHRFNPSKPLGAIVKVGDIVGYANSTGSSTGHHVHLELHNHGQRLNPQHYYSNGKCVTSGRSRGRSRR